ncbi:PRC-barrel domain-containing protein [Yoonia sp. 208BN28-4]|uniref:PRC-barrel domain-containing protein n=1 Tax=Yoonia sp. 208BN28-4 TaxID=3126505 RepID=UPI0030A2939A
MKRYLASTATAILLATGALADGHTAAFSEFMFDDSRNLNASNVIGMRVYATESDITGTMPEDGETEWDDIGEINEIVLSRDGQVENVIVGVGGFLGMGEKDVAISMDQLNFVTPEGGEADDFFLVIAASAAGVEEAPSYEREMQDSSMTDAEADMDENERTMLRAPEVERDGYETVEMADLTTEMLTGAVVYGSGDENVGEISELLLTDDGKMDRAVIDVGGFLGMGERPIAVTMDELQITRDDDGDVRVYIDSTMEALEEQPVYED